MNSTFPTEEPNMAIKIQDISPGKDLSPHIQHLMTLKGNADFISVHEWCARLCHALMVEAGFIPIIPDPTSDGLSPKEILQMNEITRISEFVQKLSPNSMFSAQGIYALKYKAIMAELVELEIPSAPGPPNPESLSGDKIHGAVDDIEDLPKPNENESYIHSQEWRYHFSPHIDVTMFFTQDKLTLTAIYRKADDPNRSLNHQFTINIEEFFQQRARMIPSTLRPTQWIRKFDLNYTRFSGFFKSKFAIYLLDQLDALVFERRGLISLPYLVIQKILRKSSIHTILNMGRSCGEMYDIVRDNRLWKFLLKRDFPAEDIDHFFPSLTSPSTSSDPPTTSLIQGQNEPDFYDIYKQKYMSKHRRIHRMNSFPLRVPVLMRFGRRMPTSMPFHFMDR